MSFCISTAFFFFFKSIPLSLESHGLYEQMADVPRWDEEEQDNSFNDPPTPALNNQAGPSATSGRLPALPNRPLVRHSHAPPISGTAIHNYFC